MSSMEMIMVWSVRQVKKSQLIGLVQFNGIGVEYRDVIGDCERGDHLNRWGGVECSWNWPKAGYSQR